MHDIKHKIQNKIQNNHNSMFHSNIRCITVSLFLIRMRKELLAAMWRHFDSQFCLWYLLHVHTNLLNQNYRSVEVMLVAVSTLFPIPSTQRLCFHCITKTQQKSIRVMSSSTTRKRRTPTIALQTSETPESPSPSSPRRSKRTKTNQSPSPSVSSNDDGNSTSPSYTELMLQAEKDLSNHLSKLTFRPPVSHVYNPLIYAWRAHEWYIRTYAKKGVNILLVGMNPGPFGMAQTGVPFGEVEAVRDFLKMPKDISASIDRPEKEHPSRPVTGLKCPRSEVSGRRLWRDFGASKFNNDANEFSQEYFVHNYCPLMFMEQKNGRNRTPVQLPASERRAIEGVCDIALRNVVRALRPKAVCGIGGYARDRCKIALTEEIQNGGLIIGTVLHPSPASPAANKGWVEKATKQLDELNEKVKDCKKDWREILD